MGRQPLPPEADELDPQWISQAHDLQLILAAAGSACCANEDCLNLNGEQASYEEIYGDLLLAGYERDDSFLQVCAIDTYRRRSAETLFQFAIFLSKRCALDVADAPRRNRAPQNPFTDLNAPPKKGIGRGGDLLRNQKNASEDEAARDDSLGLDPEDEGAAGPNNQGLENQGAQNQDNPEPEATQENESPLVGYLVKGHLLRIRKSQVNYSGTSSPAPKSKKGKKQTELGNISSRRGADGGTTQVKKKQSNSIKDVGSKSTRQGAPKEIRQEPVRKQHDTQASKVPGNTSGPQNEDNRTHIHQKSVQATTAQGKNIGPTETRISQGFERNVTQTDGTDTNSHDFSWETDSLGFERNVTQTDGTDTNSHDVNAKAVDGETEDVSEDLFKYWEIHGIKFKKDLSKESLVFESVGKWLEIKQYQCIFMNPGDFVNIEDVADDNIIEAATNDFLLGVVSVPSSIAEHIYNGWRKSEEPTLYPVNDDIELECNYFERVTPFGLLERRTWGASGSNRLILHTRCFVSKVTSRSKTIPEEVEDVRIRACSLVGGLLAQIK